MNKKHIRTIIISALILLAAITAIINVDIDSAKKQADSSAASSPAAQTKKQKAEPAQDDILLENKVHSKTQDDKPTVSSDTKLGDVQIAPADVKSEEPSLTEPQGHFCTIEIRCDTVTDTSKLENQAAAPYVPENGVILAKSKIEFTPGESVFDILLRGATEQNIHLEFRNDNLYNGKYIEGINYLYELDGGPLSGWMYKVNGKFPNYGCAACTVNDGDEIVWMYTCDLGLDVGDNSTW